jgi:hypothetical protein
MVFFGVCLNTTTELTMSVVRPRPSNQIDYVAEFFLISNKDFIKKRKVPLSTQEQPK